MFDGILGFGSREHIFLFAEGIGGAEDDFVGDGLLEDFFVQLGLDGIGAVVDLGLQGVFGIGLAGLHDVGEEELDVEDVPEHMRTITPSSADQPLPAGTLGETEKAKILSVLEQVNGNRSRAAQVLGISRRTLYRKLDEYAKEGDDK